MTAPSSLQATLLFRDVPVLPTDALKAALRELTGQHGLPTSGAVEVEDGTRLRLAALPFDICIQVDDAALAAATFNGAMRAGTGTERGPLGEIVAHHGAHVKMTVRDTGETRVRGEMLPSGAPRHRLGLLLAQDVLRLLGQHLRPLALHWHPSNQLALPAPFMASPLGTLFLPLCLRTRATVSQIDDDAAGNFAQEIEGTELILGKPVHVMATGLRLDQVRALAESFVARCLDTDARPKSGARFTGPDGRTVRIVDVPASPEKPKGLIALIELDADLPPPVAEAPKPAKVKVTLPAERNVRKPAQMVTAEVVATKAVEKPKAQLSPAAAAAKSRARQAIARRLKRDIAAEPAPAVAPTEPVTPRRVEPAAKDDQLRAAFSRGSDSAQRR
ncbi:MAG: hypothetical protein AAF667_15195 [Pseudomonadota bacterium]